jgi:asparagine synthase (glutamine-hydrolysing)
MQSFLPSAAARGLRAVLERAPEPRGYKNPVALARRFVEHAERSPDEQLLAWNAYFAGPRLARVLRRDVYGADFDPWSTVQAQADLLASARRAGRDRLGQILVHNLHTYLLDDLLVKADRMTMAVGLEARSPFLDSALVELAFRLPSELKMRHGRLKWLLREAYRGVLGPEVLDRQKHGFGVPLGRWWSGPLRPLVGELLEGDARLHAYLEASEVRALVREHLAGHRDHGQRIFALVQLELFLRGADPGWSRAVRSA